MEFAVEGWTNKAKQTLKCRAPRRYLQTNFKRTTDGVRWQKVSRYCIEREAKISEMRMFEIFKSQTSCGS